MNDIGKRITQARERAELTKSGLARRLKVTPQSVQDWENGDTQPRAERLNKLAEVLDVPLHWLAFGEGEAVAMVNKQLAVVAVPLLENATSAGFGDYASSAAICMVELSRDWISKTITVSAAGALRLYPVRGDSMSPSLLNGDTILIDTGISSLVDDGIYALRIEDSLFVKRLQRFPGHKLRVISDNPRYEPFELTDGDQFEILGKVVYSWHGSPC
jgi:phage repressor protein C with HTH and peptisase S24 domain